MKSFSDRLYELLRMRKWKKKKMAEEIGIPQSTLSGYLSGRSTPNIKDLRYYAINLGVSVGWLAGEDLFDRKDEMQVATSENTVPKSPEDETMVIRVAEYRKLAKAYGAMVALRNLADVSHSDDEMEKFRTVFQDTVSKL